jgi:dUTP pyrophosphatase
MKNLTMKAVGNIQKPAKDGDVGFNLPASESVDINPFSFAKVPTGIRVELPKGCWAAIAPRSSTNIGGSLLALYGVVDNGYRGELFVFVHNLSPTVVHVEEGQSLAQLIVMPMVVPEVTLVTEAELSSSERGTSGFGSSGK